MKGRTHCKHKQAFLVVDQITVLGLPHWPGVTEAKGEENQGCQMVSDAHHQATCTGLLSTGGVLL